MADAASLRILIVSDTHGRTDRLEKVIDQAPPFDWLIHAGDHAADDWQEVADRVQAAGKTLLNVCGNCDLSGSSEIEREFDALGVRGLVLHGHTMQVKTSPLPLYYRAREAGAAWAVYGHTHTPTLYVEDGIVFLNPGSLSDPRGYTECTYAHAVVSRTPAGVEAEFCFYTLGGTRIPAFDLTHRF